MSQVVIALGAIAAVVYAIYNFFFRKRVEQQDAQINTLTTKIDEATVKLASKREDAQGALYDYEKLKKAYDKNRSNKPN